MIESMGRLGWQELSGSGKRALVETAVGRYDGRGQETEVTIGVAVLNRMLAAGRPNSVRSARSAS